MLKKMGMLVWVFSALIGSSHTSSAETDRNQQLALDQKHATQVLDNTLFERLGGMPVIQLVVDEFIDQVAAAPKTKRSFEGIKLPSLKESVSLHLCQLTGGGCQYEGETMENAHHDAEITEAEFEAFVEMFRTVLSRHVGTREKNELLKILAPMKRQIVHKR